MRGRLGLRITMGGLSGDVGCDRVRRDCKRGFDEVGNNESTAKIDELWMTLGRFDTSSCSSWTQRSPIEQHHPMNETVCSFPDREPNGELHKIEHKLVSIPIS